MGVRRGDRGASAESGGGPGAGARAEPGREQTLVRTCRSYTSDAAHERSSVDLGGRRERVVVLVSWAGRWVYVAATAEPPPSRVVDLARALEQSLAASRRSSA